MPGSALSDLSGLLSLARDRELDLRPVILRVQTDLFVTAPARDRAMIQSFEALAGGLLPTVDDDTAALLARKLAPVADTPESILVALAARGGAARRAVIEHAPVLPAALAAAHDEGFAAMSAARADLGPADVAALVRRDDPEVDAALAANPHAVIGGAALGTLVERARETAALAAALLARADMPPAHAAALYLHAGAERRAEIRAAVAPVAVLRAGGLPVAPREACDGLVDFAMAGDAIGFAGRLAAMLRLPAAPGWGFERAERHDLLPLALLAAGVGEEDSIRIILTLDRGIALSVHVVLHLVRLYRQTSRATATYLVEAIVGAPAERQGRHMPHMQEGGTAARPGIRDAALPRIVTPDAARPSLRV